MVLFKCDWYNVLSSLNGVKGDKYGFVCVNTTNYLAIDDQYSEVKQSKFSTWLTILMSPKKCSFWEVK